MCQKLQIQCVSYLYLQGLGVHALKFILIFVRKMALVMLWQLKWWLLKVFMTWQWFCEWGQTCLFLYVTMIRGMHTHATDNIRMPPLSITWASLLFQNYTYFNFILKLQIFFINSILNLQLFPTIFLLCKFTIINILNIFCYPT